MLKSNLIASTEDLIAIRKALKGADGHRRKIDLSIARLIGYEERSEPGKNSDGIVINLRTYWINAGTGDRAKVPHYTGNMDDAETLALEVSRGERLGVSWELGAASAFIGTDPICQAATPQLALCSAAIQWLLIRKIIPAPN